jgi:hypothetical protein
MPFGIFRSLGRRTGSLNWSSAGGFKDQESRLMLEQGISVRFWFDTLHEGGRKWMKRHEN